MQNFKLESCEEERDNNNTHHEGIPPRKIRERRQSFASGTAENSSPDEIKRKKKKESVSSKRSNSNKASLVQSHEIDGHEGKKDTVEAIEKLPSPAKKDDQEAKPKEERFLMGNYLLHNQYDSYEHRENIIANQNHVESPLHSYEGSSPTDSETSSSDEDTSKCIKNQVLKPACDFQLVDALSKKNPSLNQILLGTTGIGQVLHPAPQQFHRGDSKETNDTNVSCDILDKGKVEEGDISKLVLMRNDSKSPEIHIRGPLRHNSTPPTVLQPQREAEHLKEDQIKHEEEQGQHFHHKKHALHEHKVRGKRRGKTSALSKKRIQQSGLIITFALF